MLTNKFESNWYWVSDIEKPAEVFTKHPGKYLIMAHPVTKEYRKDLIYGLLNNTSSVLKNIPKDTGYNTKLNEDMMKEPLITFLNKLGCTLEYISNSTSYRLGELCEFDVLEFKQRFKKLL